jgi:hypothetical protein
MLNFLQASSRVMRIMMLYGLYVRRRRTLRMRGIRGTACSNRLNAGLQHKHCDQKPTATSHRHIAKSMSASSQMELMCAQ